jgi:hypothetical protein
VIDGAARRYSRGVLAGLVVGFLAFQIAVPAISLLGPRPVRFGWHMYTAFAPTPLVWTEGLDGRLSEVDPDTVLVASSPEFDHGRALLAPLCRRAGVQAVVVDTLVSGRSRLTCP